MNTLERASRALVQEPAANPTSIETIRARAAQIRHRRQAAVASLTALALVIAVGGLALLRGAPSEPVTTVEPPPAVDRIVLGQGTRFVPPTRTEGDETILPITLLTGDTISLGYPTGLEIAGLGFSPGAGINWQHDGPGSACCGRTVEVRHGTIDQVFAGREPEKVYPGRDGTDVPYFRGTDVDYLAIQVGDWVVAVPDGRAYEAAGMAMTDEERAVYAASLAGHQTPDGFPVLTPSAPLTVGYADRPAASFGDGAVDVLYRNCAATTPPSYNTHDFTLEARNGESGTWLCYRSTPIVIHVGGTPAFQNQVTEGLRIVANHQAAYG